MKRRLPWHSAKPADTAEKASTRAGVLARALEVRLGLTVILATGGVTALAVYASAPATTDHQTHLAWITAASVTAVCGLVSLRTARVAGRIERELLNAGSDRRGWKAARPMIGNSPITQCWNDLVETASLQDDFRNATAIAGTGGEGEGQLAALSERALRSMPVGVAITDANYCVIRANAAFAALVEANSPSELQSQPIFSALKLESSPDHQDVAARLSGGGRNVTATARRSEKIEEGVWRISRSALAGREADAQGAVWLLQDVTQQAMAVNARDDFLTAATHELRTPLANIKAYAETLSNEEEVSIEEQKEFCNIINDETIRLNRLVDDLLAVSQLEAGAMVVARDDVDLQRAILEAVDNARPQIEKKDHTLNLNVPPQLPVVKGDKDKLIAIIVNLLGNAAKYTPEGGRIELNVEIKDESIALTVADNGVGIATDELPKLFDKFFRSADQRIREITGNGLGLAFSREVAQLHGGDITVESVLEEGSQFTFTLPLPPKS